MPHFKTSLKVSIISQIIAVFVLAAFPIVDSFAKAGCCSHHGGVTGCNTSTGHQLCKDGTTSPSCPCNGSNSKTKPAKTTTTTTTTTVTKPAPVPAPIPTETTTSKTTTSKTTMPKGCCSRHGGVAQCNKGTGYFMCKDGTQSTSCKCS